nr:unnamed protein product [Digitaria exilis]
MIPEKRSDLHAQSIDSNRIRSTDRSSAPPIPTQPPDPMDLKTLDPDAAAGPMDRAGGAREQMEAEQVNPTHDTHQKVPYMAPEKGGQEGAHRETGAEEAPEMRWRRKRAAREREGVWEGLINRPRGTCFPSMRARRSCKPLDRGVVGINSGKILRKPEVPVLSGFAGKPKITTPGGTLSAIATQNVFGRRRDDERKQKEGLTWPCPGEATVTTRRKWHARQLAMVQQYRPPASLLFMHGTLVLLLPPQQPLMGHLTSPYLSILCNRNTCSNLVCLLRPIAKVTVLGASFSPTACTCDDGGGLYRRQHGRWEGEACPESMPLRVTPITRKAPTHRGYTR